MTERDIEEVRNGVSSYWLSQAFRMTPESIRRRLATCPVISKGAKGVRYDLKKAASYLVDPKIDFDHYLRNMKSTDLPASLQKEIWDARLKRQKWEVHAGELWRTSDVMAVLSSTFAIVKSTIQLWPDTIERQTGMTNQQRESLIALGDALQDEIYQNLIEAAKDRSTRASLVSIDDGSGDSDDLEDVL